MLNRHRSPCGSSGLSSSEIRRVTGLCRFRSEVQHVPRDCLPNQSMEPTATAVTPRADARVAPAVAVAHH